MGDETLPKENKILDKNGKEIHQGDYVRITLENGVDMYAVCRSDGFYYAIQESAETVKCERIPHNKVQKKQLEFVFCEVI